MEIKFKKTTGKFAYTVTAMLGDVSPLEAYLCEQGIVRELQGAVLQGWEKAIAYPNGKRKDLPKVTDEVSGELREWSRSDIPFSQENADLLAKHVGALKIDIGTDGSDGKHVENLVDAGIVDVEVEEYNGAEKALPKFAAEKSFIKSYLFEADGTTPKLLKSGAVRTIESFCASRELEVPTDPYEEDTDFLRAVKAWFAAQSAND